MSNIVSIKVGKGCENSDLKTIRAQYGLNKVEAAKALSVSAATIENWERDPTNAPSLNDLTNRFQLYCSTAKTEPVGNLLFGEFPLKTARTLLGLSAEQMAAKYGFSASTWLKFETNHRALRSEVLLDVEATVRERFLAACGR